MLVERYLERPRSTRAERQRRAQPRSVAREWQHIRRRHERQREAREARVAHGDACGAHFERRVSRVAHEREVQRAQAREPPDRARECVQLERRLVRARQLQITEPRRGMNQRS